jgi:arylmalonate decarboxylase
MMRRRDFLTTTLAGMTSPVFGSTERTLGLIFPVPRSVPPEAQSMYPSGMRYVTADVGLTRMTPQGYDEVLERIAPAAARLAQQGAEGIALLGTSLSFYQGAAFNRSLTQRMARASGRPAVTMSTAVVEGLRSVGGRRLAVATAYNDEVNGRLRTFLGEEGFEVLVVRGLGIEKVEDVDTVTQKGLIEFSVSVFKSAPSCDAMLISCGGLRTLELLEPVERRCGIPVVSSLPHALRAGVRLLGLSGQAPGYGKLLATA